MRKVPNSNNKVMDVAISAILRFITLFFLIVFALTACGDGGGGGGNNPKSEGRLKGSAAFDLPAIRDAATATCLFIYQRSTTANGVLVDIWEVSYNSWESIDGTLNPILIKGFAARPNGAVDPVPGVVLSHGLGGWANETSVVDRASDLGMMVLGYTGPGEGNSASNSWKPTNVSEGRAADYNSGYRLFDTLWDIRGSWIWGHAVAALRGITCLETRSDVDINNLGMTGFSIGGVATMIAGSVDDRILAAVPLSGTLAWDVSVQSNNSWFLDLLSTAGLNTGSQEWIYLQEELINPSVLLPGNTSKFMMVNGSVDEFFPLTAIMETYNTLPGANKRSSLIGNYDHGCWGSGVPVMAEDAPTIEARAVLRAKGAQKMWFNHWFGTNPDYSVIPAQPTFTTSYTTDAIIAMATCGIVAPALKVSAIVDTSPANLTVEEVRAWISNDLGLNFGSFPLAQDSTNTSLFESCQTTPKDENTIIYVDVQYRTNGTLPERFSISTDPTLPVGTIPVRGKTSCMP